MTKTKAMLSLTCAAIIVGSTLAISRLITEGTSLYTLQFFSMILASILLAIWIRPRKVGKALKAVSKKDVFYLGFQALTGVVLFRILIVYGVRMTNALDAGVILSFVPIATVILSIIFLGERLTRAEWLAVSFAFIGVLTINIAGLGGSSDQGHVRLFGNFLILLATISEGAFAVLSKKVSDALSPLMKSFMLCVSSVIFLAPFSLMELVSNHSFLVTKGFWLLTLYTGIVLTVMAYIFWFSGVAHVSATTAGVFNTLIPVSSIVLVSIIFKETMTGIQLIGLTFVMGGVMGMIVSNKGDTETFVLEDQ